MGLRCLVMTCGAWLGLAVQIEDLQCRLRTCHAAELSNMRADAASRHNTVQVR